MSNQVTPTPLYDTLQQFRRTVMSGLRVCLPGTVSGVDLANGTVDVTVGVMQNVAAQGFSKGQDFKYPQLTGCPVITLQGGGVGAVMPIKVDDECLVVFSDRCISNWIMTGEATPLPDLRMHDINDGFVLVGLNSMANLLATPLTADEGGICETQNPTGAAVAVNSATSLVSIRNGSQSLKQVLDTLFTALTTLNTAIAADPVFQATSPGVVAAATAANVSIALTQAALAQLLY